MKLCKHHLITGIVKIHMKIIKGIIQLSLMVLLAVIWVHLLFPFCFFSSLPLSLVFFRSPLLFVVPLIFFVTLAILVPEKLDEAAFLSLLVLEHEVFWVAFVTLPLMTFNLVERTEFEKLELDLRTSLIVDLDLCPLVTWDEVVCEGCRTVGPCISTKVSSFCGPVDWKSIALMSLTLGKVRSLMSSGRFTLTTAKPASFAIRHSSSRVVTNSISDGSTPRQSAMRL